MKVETKAELLDKLIDRYWIFVKWVLRRSPAIEELTLVRDHLKEIDSVKAQIRASEQGSSPVEQSINTNIKTYICTDCKAVNYLPDNGEIRVGFCGQCGHPLWNPSQVEQPTEVRTSIEILAIFSGCKTQDIELFIDDKRLITPNMALKAMEEYAQIKIEKFKNDIKHE